MAGVGGNHISHGVERVALSGGGGGGRSGFCELLQT